MLTQEIVLRALFNSFMISTLATVLSLGVTVTSGYMLSRFKGPIPNAWFSLIYVFRCVPYVSWVLPLYFVTQQLRIFDTYWGLLLPHVAVHICFFSWIMKGFFDGIDPSMEYAAMIDGCSRWGAFLRVAMPAAIPGLTALAILCWLYTWNEFLFALILTAHETPILTVVMAQFVHELGMEWHLMSATAVIALVPALIVTLFGQRYVIRGLKDLNVMAEVVLTNVHKAYGHVVAVKDFNLDIKDREFVVLVGPSGCGKSTTLRMIAGLEDISGGTIAIGGRVVNHLQPKDRDIAMVFQNYALYQHMSVCDNLAFGLRNRRVPETRDRGRRRAARRGSCRSSRCSTAGRTSCRAASSSAWRSAAASCAILRSFCSTSRCPISTPSCARRCASSSRSCACGFRPPRSSSPTTRSRR